MAIAKRKKRFFDVEIPLIGKTTHLLAFDLEELKDKIITYDLTRLLRGKSANFSLNRKLTTFFLICGHFEVCILYIK